MTSPTTTDGGKAARTYRGEAACQEEDHSGDLWLLCTAGSHRFALPMSSVIETMRLLPIEAVAGAPCLVCGLSVVRGVAVPVIDTARLFGEEAARYERLVTVRTDERIVAFAASAVSGVQWIGRSEREELPPLLRDTQTIAALARLDGKLVFFLRSARMLPDDFQAGDDAGVRHS